MSKNNKRTYFKINKFISNHIHSCVVHLYHEVACNTQNHHKQLSATFCNSNTVRSALTLNAQFLFFFILRRTHLVIF